MADYIYLLENRLSSAQQRALSLIRDRVRSHELTVFLTGGAVRDLTGGGSVRDLDVTVQGNPGFLGKELESLGAVLVGENAPAQAFYFRFPGGVRVEIAAAMSVSFPKPGKPKYEPASIAEDLRRRDFTANAMALSLNEGSYGLLMDPLNGVADIENRELRLVNNYGFLDEPSRMVRAARLSSRLGWQMEEKTRQRYNNAKEEGAIAAISNFNRGYELEEVFHEEDPLRIMRALEVEGWLQVLAPEMILGKANEAALADLRERQGQLQTQGILSDGAALAFPLLISKLPASAVESLKASFARPGFVKEIETLEARTRDLQGILGSKDAATPSTAWRMLHEAEPELVLSMFYGTKSQAIQARIKTFLNDSPSARQRLPYALLQEMRITPDHPEYNDLLDKLFFELMDGKLGTTEELKAYLEPFSPPAPPPPLNLRRARAKKEPRASRAKAKKVPATVAEQEEALGVAEGLMEEGTLTGPDRGTEPDPPEQLVGKVAPLASGEEEAIPVQSKPARPKRPAKPAVLVPAAISAVPTASSTAAAKLPAKPAPMPEEQALLPHPIATKEIAEEGSSVIPHRQPEVVAHQQERKQAYAKQVSIAPPVRIAAEKEKVKSGSKPATTPKPVVTAALATSAKKPTDKTAVKAAAAAKKPATSTKALKLQPAAPIKSIAVARVKAAPSKPGSKTAASVKSKQIAKPVPKPLPKPSTKVAVKKGTTAAKVMTLNTPKNKAVKTAAQPIKGANKAVKTSKRR